MDVKKLVLWNHSKPFQDRITVEQIERRRALLPAIVRKIKIYCLIVSEITPALEIMAKKDRLLNRVGRKEKSIPDDRPDYKNKYLATYSESKNDSSDLSCENNPIFEAIKVIKNIENYSEIT